MAVISELNPNQPSKDGLAGQGDDFLRLINDALITCFGGVDGPVNSGTGNPLATANELTALFDRISAIEGNTGAGIAGEIRQYYGTYESICRGGFWWALITTLACQRLRTHPRAVRSVVRERQAQQASTCTRQRAHP